MIKLYHHPKTRSLRVLWLLEELGLAYSLETPELCLPAEGQIFAQATPTGRFPTIEDGPITMCESGAIVEYLIERYGGGYFAPPKDSPLRAKYLQWIHYPEGTMSPYLSAIHRFETAMPEKIAIMKKEFDIAIGFADQALGDSKYIVGEDFTGADIMLAVSLLSANMLGLLNDRHKNISVYLQRLQSRRRENRAWQTATGRQRFAEVAAASFRRRRSGVETRLSCRRRGAHTRTGCRSRRPLGFRRTRTDRGDRVDRVATQCALDMPSGCSSWRTHTRGRR